MLNKNPIKSLAIVKTQGAHRHFVNGKTNRALVPLRTDPFLLPLAPLHLLDSYQSRNVRVFELSHWILVCSEIRAIHLRPTKEAEKKPKPIDGNCA